MPNDEIVVNNYFGPVLFDDLVKSQKSRHSYAKRNPDLVPAKAGNQC